MAGGLGWVPVVLGLGLGALMVRPSSAAAPLEEIAGEYAGRVKYKDQVIDPAEESGGSGTVDVGLSVSQEGTAISGAFLIHGNDGEPDELLFGEGRAGNGKFWFAADAEGSSIVLFGSMKGVEGSRLLKGKGVYLADTQYADVKFTLKEGDSGIVF